MSFSTTITKSGLRNLKKISYKFTPTSYATPDSIGPWFASHGRIQCWELRGEALVLWEQLRRDIDDAMSHEVLPRPIVWTCYICGKTIAKSRATVIIWGGDRASRERAQQVIREEQIMHGYSEFLVCLMEREPGLQNPVALMQRLRLNYPAQSLQLWTDPKREHLILVCEAGRQSLMSGPVKIDGKSYYMTSAHAFTEDSMFNGMEEHKFAEFEDLFDDDDEPIEGTSVGSCSSVRSSPSRDFSPSTQDTIRTEYQSPEVAIEDSVSAPASQIAMDKASWSSNEVEILLGTPHLDYMLVDMPNHLVMQQTAFSNYHWQTKECSPPSGQVVIATPRRSLYGRFLLSSVSIKATTSLQLWIWIPDTTSDHVRRGDSGAWAYAHQKIHGHVIAGDLKTGKAFIVPSYIVHKDIMDRFLVRERTTKRKAIADLEAIGGKTMRYQMTRSRTSGTQFADNAVYDERDTLYTASKTLDKDLENDDVDPKKKRCVSIYESTNGPSTTTSGLSDTSDVELLGLPPHSESSSVYKTDTQSLSDWKPHRGGMQSSYSSQESRDFDDTFKPPVQVLDLLTPPDSEERTSEGSNRRLNGNLWNHPKYVPSVLLDPTLHLSLQDLHGPECESPVHHSAENDSPGYRSSVDASSKAND